MKSFINKTRLNNETEKLLTRQARLSRRIYPGVRNCRIVLDQKLGQYRVVFSGSHQQQPVRGMAKDHNPLKAFLKAFHRFSRKIEETKPDGWGRRSPKAHQFAY